MNYLIQVLSVLLQHSIDLGWRMDNPAQRFKRLQGGEGHRPWEEAEIKAFRGRWALGTFERTAFELAINTGQRGGDIAKMKRSDIRSDGFIYVKQNKTNDEVWIQISGDLRAALDTWYEHQAALVQDRLSRIKPLAVATIREMILTGDRGSKVTVDYLRHRMKEAYEAVSPASSDHLTGMTTHGLRYTTVVVLSELGCTDDIISAITGRQTLAMVRKCQEKKRHAKLAIAAMNDAGSQRQVVLAAGKVQNQS